MKSSFIAAAVALVLAASPALATLYITNPVASTSANGGDHITIEWQDTGSPALSRWDGINLWLATGSTTSQYKLDDIVTNLSTSRTSRRYRIPADAGPSGDYYFIRAESTDLAANGTASYQAFSAKFTLTGMRGNFNATVLAAAQGAAVVPGSSTSTSATGVVRPGMTTSTSSSAATASGAVNGTANASSGVAVSNGTSTSGAEPLYRPQHIVVGALGAVAAGVAVLL